MRYRYLDGRRMTDKVSAHAHLQEKLGFPDYYGANLDALYDCLTEIGDDTTICLTAPEAAQKALGDYGNQLLSTLRDAGVDNPRLRVIFSR